MNKDFCYWSLQVGNENCNLVSIPELHALSGVLKLTVSYPRRYFQTIIETLRQNDCIDSTEYLLLDNKSILTSQV